MKPHTPFQMEPSEQTTHNTDQQDTLTTDEGHRPQEFNVSSSLIQCIETICTKFDKMTPRRIITICRQY